MTMSRVYSKILMISHINWQMKDSQIRRFQKLQARLRSKFEVPKRLPRYGGHGNGDGRDGDGDGDGEMWRW